MTSPSASDESGMTRTAHVLWLTAILLGGLLVMSRSKADPDLWGHVQYGKDVLQDGRLHPTTTWSYAVSDHRWINHENIAELLLAAADSAGGQAGLLLLKAVLTLLLLGLPLWYAKRCGAGLLSCAVVTSLLAFGISFHWLIRPHMLSYVSAAGLICLLAVGVPSVVSERPNSHPQGGRWLWLSPLLMCFWTNSHGGYLAGMAILMAWLGLDAVDLLMQRDHRFARTVRHHALLFAACCLGCLCNPYGLELHSWMLSSLGRPRPEISEWAPLPVLTVSGLPFWMIVLTTLLCRLRSQRPFRWPGMVLMGLLAWQALSHQRHLPFLAITAAFVLVPHVESVIRRMLTQMAQQAAERSHVPDHRRGSVAALAVACVTVIVLTCLQYPRQATLHVDRGFYPVSALQYMSSHQLGGRVLVTFNWAQYALASFACTDPESRIAIDGRFRTCYPQPVIDMYFDFILGESPETGRYREAASGPFDPHRALKYASPNLVLLERQRHPEATQTIRSTPDWCLLYQDSLAELWGRAEMYDDESSPDWIPESQRHLSNDPQSGSVAWPAFPVKRVATVASAGGSASAHSDRSVSVSH